MIVYILKTTVCLALFIAFYKLFLERENMHVFKRFYLLASIVIAIAIPAIIFTEYVYIEPQPRLETFAPDYALEEFQNTPIPENTNYLYYILWTVYSLGVLVFGFKYCQNLIKIGYRIRKNPKVKNHHITNVLLKEKLAPHTFFNFIFLNKLKFEAQEIPNEVLLHEKTHADQKHSIDVLFIELLQVIFWFNPLVYVFKQSIKLNHEFLADHAVMQKGVETTRYQKILLAFSSNANIQETALTNAINYSSIKKRFTVMKKNTSKKAIWLRSLFVVPVFVLALYSFSESEIIEIQKTIENKDILANINSELEKVNALQLNYVQAEQYIISEDITILINKNGQLLVQDDLVDISNLSEYLSKFNSDLTKEQRSKQVRALIHVVPETPKQVIKEVNSILEEYGCATINIAGPVKNQDGATKAQISEYNALASKYNSMNPNNMRIKKSEVDRMGYLYGLMTEKQKKQAESYPDIPPMPEPPPPPIPANSTPEQKKKMQGVIDNYEYVYKRKVHQEKTSDGENINIIVVDDSYDVPTPPNPPAPKSPIDLVIEMAKKDATFYYEDKTISSDYAIELFKKNKNLNIDIREINSKKPVVRISKDPISIEN